MAGIASMLGIGSSRTEISDDEASDYGSESAEDVPAPEPVKVKQEKKGKAKAKVEEPEPEESLMVESEHNDEEDEEIGEDEYVLAFYLYLKSANICAPRYVVEKITNHIIDGVRTYWKLQRRVC